MTSYLSQGLSDSDNNYELTDLKLLTKELLKDFELLIEEKKQPYK
jgi:hypothetical protein